ncbi:MAG: terminase small subunit [Qingshengfaniella sp.]
MKLTEKQKRFAAEYLTDLNGTQAAIRAGYSAKTAGQMAEKLLKKGEIQSLVQQGMGARAKRTAITQDYVLQAIHETAERCRQNIAPVVDRRGNPVFEELPDGQMAQVFAYDAKNTLRALELMGRHLGIFNDKLKVEHSFSDLSDDELKTEIAMLEKQIGK